MLCLGLFHHNKKHKKDHITLLFNQNNLYNGHSSSLRVELINQLVANPGAFVASKPTELESSVNSKIVGRYTNRVYAEFDLSKQEYDDLISQLSRGSKVDGLFIQDYKAREKASNKLHHHLVKCHVEVQDPETEVWKLYKTINFHFRFLDTVEPYTQKIRMSGSI